MSDVKGNNSQMFRAFSPLIYEGYQQKPDSNSENTLNHTYYFIL